jgi:hypothetical protein
MHDYFRVMEVFFSTNKVKVGFGFMFFSLKLFDPGKRMTKVKLWNNQWRTHYRK